MPERPSILINLTATLIELEEWPNAEKLSLRLLSLEPHSFDGLINLGVCMLHLSKYDEALELFNQASEINPKSPSPWINKGLIFLDQGRIAESSKCLDEALFISPDSQEALIALGNIANELENYEAAIELFNKVLHINPKNTKALWNKSLSLLRLGKFKEGWELYESRWQIAGMRQFALKKLTLTLWLGKESLKNKSILIHAEQGYGDTIQFCRYIPLIESMGCKVIFQVPKPLLGLMRSLGQNIEVIENDAINLELSSRKIEFYCPIMSLALAFRTTLETIPNKIPYLFASDDEITKWKDKLQKISDGKIHQRKVFRVGIAWSGSGHYAGKRNLKRDIPLDSVVSLVEQCFDMIPVEFHSLQIEKEKNHAVSKLIKESFYSHSEDLQNFQETAALMVNLDLIVSIDTSTAHLAGALNLPTLLLLPRPPDFMFQMDRSDTPWYPSIQIIRQESRSRWPITKIANSIEQYFLKK